MNIQVWKGGLFPKLIGRNNLITFIKKGEVFASWRYPAGQKELILVREDLAKQILNVKSIPCPHVGEYPEYGFFKSGYHCNSVVRPDDESETIFECDECGFEMYQPGNARFNNVLNGRYGESHPLRTIMVSDKKTSTIKQADWNEDQKMLIPSISTGTLIIWIYGSFLEGNPRKVFPNAQKLYKTNKYIILKS
ncbi:hypothetical protein COX95_00245 [bacterium CG_4_10_14_0_2_um_filter_33_32]|nr:MAG: hypothetical protein AUJ93_03415 [bacterium CG2_30_33_46]PIR67344.1 MAG: hypothetical protein COU50_03770 [bacterium CG10_big_fil_rev_8_21_14_0_10_33_18]PIU77139.1 MAG: hypothetical protein COS74_00355 [bacterium CG06_land_8_20_14_3_00_33_50]PIW81703.1 MAG: hypothetical protein COZ97_00380 [bacterium CG_4_8_14_3_um_filter_33_28]PIY85011.1 MAG: hypothetical protein COY76_04390 [bacterium CG_4_10_14_0_8_um_filter_33_57]PIZ86667.1 MAG: hypothetical protein COX95_00245 [bacterium CG_4_10_1